MLKADNWFFWRGLSGHRTAQKRAKSLGAGRKDTLAPYFYRLPPVSTPLLLKLGWFSGP